jgi:hypothetical protein
MPLGNGVLGNLPALTAPGCGNLLFDERIGGYARIEMGAAAIGFRRPLL